ncbi:MAG: hypothetical protein IBJ11_10940 [Phycisphaerales bacterium]|nr:hypothetical protein [Phycisphaerales bacterium]
MLAARAMFLEPDERALVLSIYRERLTVKAAAGMLGQKPATVRARLRRLTRRLLSDEFAFVMRQRERWPARRRRIATAVVLHGRTYRAAARALGLTYDAVRREMLVVRTVHASARGETVAPAQAGTGVTHAA